MSWHNIHKVFTFTEIKKICVSASAAGFLLFLGAHFGDDEALMYLLHPNPTLPCIPVDVLAEATQAHELRTSHAMGKFIP